MIDGAGSVAGRTAAFGQAMALKPDGIVINGFDAVEQQAGAGAGVKAAGIPMVSLACRPGDRPRRAERHLRQRLDRRDAGVGRPRRTGPMPTPGGKPGVVIFTDSTYADRHRQGRQDEGR